MTSIKTYFIIRCDDHRRPKEVQTDTYFEISDFDSATHLKWRLDRLCCRYDFLIETFDSSTDSVISNDYIVHNNYLNSSQTI